jgi:hypothetical protein
MNLKNEELNEHDTRKYNKGATKTEVFNGTNKSMKVIYCNSCTEKLGSSVTA